jgi:hypothetical protein
VLVLVFLVSGGHSDETPATLGADKPALDQAKPSPTPPPQLYKGRVVRVVDALKTRGIKAYAEELKDSVALETADGELVPILPDWRGRAFSQDARLRDRDVELVGFRRKGLPYLNVMSVYTFDKQGRRQYTDYWCDICSIPMYEIKPCDCCQQEIRLRFQHQEITELNPEKPGTGPKTE